MAQWLLSILIALGVLVVGAIIIAIFAIVIPKKTRRKI